MGKTHGRHTGNGPGWGRVLLALIATCAAAGLLVAITHSVASHRVVTQTRTVTKTVTVPGPVRVRTDVVTRPASKPAPGRYTVQPGDTIWNIAAAQYTTAVEKANAALLQRQHGIIYAGQVLKIPIVQS